MRKRRAAVVSLACVVAAGLALDAFIDRTHDVVGSGAHQGGARQGGVRQGGGGGGAASPDAAAGPAGARLRVVTGPRPQGDGPRDPLGLPPPPRRRLSLMLPLGPASRNADHGRLELLLRSLAKFFDLDAVETLLVATPNATTVRLLLSSIARRGGSSALDALVAKADVVNDAELAPEVAQREERGRNHVSGYTKQQIMKLAAAARVSTEYYLTLDADVLCVRPTGYDDLIRGPSATSSGRAVVNMTPLSRHRDWFKAADHLLGTSLGHDRADDWPVMGVTPSLMHAASVRELGKALERRHPSAESWREVLATHDDGHWTGEYALYFTYLCRDGDYGRFDELYDRHAKEAMYLSSGFSVWDAEGFAAFDPRRAFGDAEEDEDKRRGYFIIVQSRSGVTPAAVREAVEPYLRLPP